MGAGVAYPETISDDVIFPNYNWPDLARVKEEWNVTTFVVLSTQMIKDMKDMESYNGTIIISKQSKLISFRRLLFYCVISTSVAVPDYLE